MIPQQVNASFVPMCAGLFVSFVDRYIITNPKFDACCTTAEPEEFDWESDDTKKTELTDTFSKASGATTATLPMPHPIYTAHHIPDKTHH